MELISIIPDFKPMNDRRLLEKAEKLKPVLKDSWLAAPEAIAINGKNVSPEVLSESPLRRGDRVLLDFGRHVVGHLTLHLDAAGSHQDAPAFIRLDLAEVPGELTEDPEEYNGWLSRSWIQREQLHLDRLPVSLALPRRYAFRYVRLTVLDTSPKYQLLIRGAECTSQTAADWDRVPPRSFRDGELQKLYETGLKTLCECTQDVMEDGPKRDRRLWLGDLRLQAQTSYISFRSLDVIKRCLYLFAGTRFPDGRMSANVFTEPVIAADDTYLCDYALLYPITLEEYLAESSDEEALLDLTGPALEQARWALDHCLDRKDVVKPEAGKTAFIDWSDDLDRTAALQGVLICSLDACASLCKRLGNEGDRDFFLRRAGALRDSAMKAFWSREDQCFLSGGQISVHSQVWLTLAGLMKGDTARRAMKTALESASAPSMLTPYMHHYYIEALLHAGLREEAEGHMRAYWGGMLKAGADTFWECFDPNDLRSSPYGGMIVNSYCHAWSCTPAYLITRFFA